MGVREFTLSFAGLRVGFSSEVPVKVPSEFVPFLTEGGELTDSYCAEVIREPLGSCGELLFKRDDISAYREADGTLLIYSSMEIHGLCPGCKIRDNGQHTLYVTEELACSMGQGIRLGGIINGEEMLLRHRAMVLHCSVVNHGGQGILFSGPSGIGKSTQGALWEKAFGDHVINGDRGILRLCGDTVYAGGSPWCGSSGIYSMENIPVKAIVLLRQGKENVILPADPKIAFREIYSQCIVHAWDRCYVDRLCDLIWEVLDRVPVYVLTCLPEISAALLTENTVFRREKGCNL